MNSITQPFPAAGQSFTEPRFGVVRRPGVRVVKHSPAAPIVTGATSNQAAAAKNKQAVSGKADAFVLITVIWVSISVGLGAAWLFGI